jgi:hypothetical protein
LYNGARFTNPLPTGAARIVRLIVAVRVRLPDVPVMVTVEFPGLAEAVAESLTTAVEGVIPALNVATTPLGTPETVTVTVPENPFCGVSVIVLLPDVPGAMLSVVGEAVKVNDGGGTIVSVTAVFALRLPEAPAIVTVAVPAGALELAVKVTVLAPAVLAGLKLAVTPLGRPEAVSATVPLKPFCPRTAITLAPVAP